MAVVDDAAGPFLVHRCRFVDWTPSPITAIAFSPRPLPRKGHLQQQKQKQSRALKPGFLAVGRDNGNIELCDWVGDAGSTQCPQAWVPRITLPGPVGTKVDNIAFSLRDRIQPGTDEALQLHQVRLFSTSGGADLLEWDLHTGQILNTLNSQGGSIWSMAVNPASTVLALGCQDGAVRLIDIRDGTLSLQRRFDRVKSRLLSIAWGPPIARAQKPQATDASSDSDDDDEDMWEDRTIVTGCSDSCLRKWDVKTGRVMDRMTTDKVRNEATLVWAVGVFANGVIVSGDSMGNVKFWDSLTSTQIHSFPAHGADVLCLTIGPDGRTVYTSGVDQKITEFSLVQVSTDGSDSAHRWVQTTARRLHAHDVRALAMWPSYTPLQTMEHSLPKTNCPVLASGGLDMSVALTACASPLSSAAGVTNILATSKSANFSDSYQRRMPYVTTNMQVCTAKRLVVCRRDTGVAIWRVPCVTRATFAEDTSDGSWQKVLEMGLSVRTNLICSAISDDGAWLAVSDLYDVKLFQLRHEQGTGLIRPRRIKSFCPAIQSQTSLSGASALAFTHDSSRLVLCYVPSGAVLVVDLTAEAESFTVLGRIGPLGEGRRGERTMVEIRDVELTDDGSDKKEEGVWITGVALSGDDRWVATSDAEGRTRVIDLVNLRHQASLPFLGQSVRALAFSPSTPSTLLLALRSNALHAYSVLEKRLALQEPLKSSSVRLGVMHDCVMGLAFEANGRESTVLVWGSTWIYRLLLDGLGPPPSPRKRRRGVQQQTDDSKINGAAAAMEMETKYRAMPLLAYVGSRELVVVERPLVAFLEELPPAYFRHRYGT